MRGSPLFRAVLAFLIILSLGLPLWRLTRASDVQSVKAQTVAPAAEKAIHLQLDFTARPKNVKVVHLGKEVWSEERPAAEIERDLSLPYPAEGVDLQFHIEWPEDAGLAAARVRLTDPAGQQYEKSLWGTGVVDDVLTFP